MEEEHPVGLDPDPPPLISASSGPVFKSSTNKINEIESEDDEEMEIEASDEEDIYEIISGEEEEEIQLLSTIAVPYSDEIERFDEGYHQNYEVPSVDRSISVKNNCNYVNSQTVPEDPVEISTLKEFIVKIEIPSNRWEQAARQIEEAIMCPFEIISVADRSETIAYINTELMIKIMWAKSAEELYYTVINSLNCIACRPRLLLEDAEFLKEDYSLHQAHRLKSYTLYTQTANGVYSSNWCYMESQGCQNNNKAVFNFKENKMRIDMADGCGIDIELNQVRFALVSPNYIDKTLNVIFEINSVCDNGSTNSSATAQHLELKLINPEKNALYDFMSGLRNSNQGKLVYQMDQPVINPQSRWFSMQP